MENRKKFGEASGFLKKWFETKQFLNVRINFKKPVGTFPSECYNLDEEISFQPCGKKCLSATVAITDDQKYGLGIWGETHSSGDRYLWGFEPFSSDMHPIITALDEVANGNFFVVESKIFGKSWLPLGKLATSRASRLKLRDSDAMKSGLPLAKLGKLNLIFSYKKSDSWT